MSSICSDHLPPILLGWGLLGVPRGGFVAPRLGVAVEVERPQISLVSFGAIDGVASHRCEHERLIEFLGPGATMGARYLHSPRPDALARVGSNMID
jgi:hypothetical protein